VRVLPDYVFLGIARRARKRRKIDEILTKDSEILVYGNDEEEVVMVRHKTHLERLLSLTAALHETFAFENIYFGCELQSDFHHRKRREPINLSFISPRGNLTLSVLEDKIGEPFDRIFRMFGEEWILLYAGNLSLHRSPILRTVQKSTKREIVGLLEIWKHIPRAVGQQKKSQYDPITTRTRELGYQLTQARSFTIRELDALNDQAEEMRSSRMNSLEYRLRFIRNVLETENAKIKTAGSFLKPDFETIEECQSVLNCFGSVINTLRSEPYCQKIKHRWTETSSQLLESFEILSVEDAFVLEAYNSLKLKGLCPITIPSKDYNCRIVEILENQRVIELPITLSPRLGLLPIVYHLAAHLAAEEVARTKVVPSPNLKEEIQAIFTDDVKSNHVTRSINDTFLAAREILADLFAAEIGGPAYLYAFSRAFPFEEELEPGGYHRLTQRLYVISSFLRTKGFRLRLDVLPARDQEFSDVFPYEIFDLISNVQPQSVYSRSMHESMLTNVKPTLIEGEVRPVRPSLVTNALWDAVLNGDDYLNENAAFLSVLRWQRQKRSCKPS
jgi:hypothetical protein